MLSMVSTVPIRIVVYRLLRWAGHIPAALGARRRLAAGVAVPNAHHPCCKAPCGVCGGKFSPVILTNHGDWYYHSNDFMVESPLAHVGKLAAQCVFDPSRFVLNGASSLQCYGEPIQTRHCRRIRWQVCFPRLWELRGRAAPITHAQQAMIGRGLCDSLANAGSYVH